MTDRDRTRLPLPPLIFAGALVVVLVVVALVLDWLDPCTGQFTDALGCLADQWSEYVDSWSQPSPMWP